MATQVQSNTDASLARSVAPDDLRRGDFVAVLNEVFECPSWYWSCDEQLSAREDLVRIVYRPNKQIGDPLRVVDLCLPFVFVEQSDGKHRTLDIRGCQLVRLTPSYALGVRQAMRQDGKKKKKRSS